MSRTIVFFGSGPVAAESLALLHNDFEIEAVITKPQPKHHKEPFPVIALANKLNLNIFTANSQKELSNLFDMNVFQSEVGVIIDHGIIIEQKVIDSFKFGIINSHFSLLPRWRGADPISFSILSGDKETGVSIMVIVDKLDEGALLKQQPINIDRTITTPELTNILIQLSHDLLTETVPLYLEDKLNPCPQSTENVSYSHKLTKKDGILDWNKSADQLEREVRAYIGWPRSRASISNYEVVVTKAHAVQENGKTGTLSMDDNELGVFCNPGLLMIDNLIPSGKKEMSSQAFLNGYKII